jgi:hypothetical protein
MSDRHIQPDMDDVTGITSLATKALLEGLANDVREMRGEVASNTGIAIRIEDRQKSIVDHMLSTDMRLKEIETDFRQHQADEKVWQLQQQSNLEKVTTQLALVAPLTAAHEQILQQAKGAAWATKMLYVVAGAIGVGGIQSIIHILTTRR